MIVRSRLLQILMTLTFVMGSIAPTAAQEGCFQLSLNHTGMGADPVGAALGSGTTWSEHGVAGPGDGLGSIYAADVDGDGDLDAAAAGDTLGASSVGWWENVSGDGTDWIGHLVDDDFPGSETVHVADLDGDGDADLLGASFDDDEIAWWENTSRDGTSWVKRVVTTSFSGAWSVYTADLDGDSDLDVLAAAQTAGDVVWWENFAGDGTVWSEHALDRSFEGARAIHAEDLDRDGDIDVLAGGFDGISWWENLSGDGADWGERTLDDTFEGARTVHAADLDGDGDPDVLGGAPSRVTWWENLSGDGSIWGERSVDDSIQSPQSIFAADVDGDQDLDILGAAFTDGNQLIWWENSTADGTIWTQRIVDGFTWGESVHAGDLDGDGDLDFLAAFLVGDNVRWWENTYLSSCPVGEYQAADRVVVTAVSDAGWGVGGWIGTEDDASTASENLVVMPAADAAASVTYLEGCFALTRAHTGMGADPLARPASSAGCQEDSFVVGEGIELLAVPDAGWEVAAWSGSDDDTSKALLNAVTMPAEDRRVSVDYLDGCFFLSLLHVGEGADPIADPPNSDGCADGEFRLGEVVTLTAVADPGYDVGHWRGTDDDGSRDVTNTVTVSDVNARAGVAYVVDECYRLTLGHTGSGTDPLAWPQGDGTTWGANQIEDSFQGAESVYAADIDGDGDPDVLGAAFSIGTISWWERVVADEVSWTEHVVDESFFGAQSVHAADVDGDGDQDVLGAAATVDEIAWWENLTGNGTTWIKHVVANQFDGSAVYAADVDGDGDFDIIGAAYFSDEIVWWENHLGDGTSWAKHVVDGEFSGAHAVYATDIDGDGNLDLLGAATRSHDVIWWRNVSGDGTVWDRQIVDNDFRDVQSVHAADVDGDGDIDVLAAGWNGGHAWWENLLGDGTFWVQHGLNRVFGDRAIYAVDLDGDADVDVLGASEFADEIKWWENVYGDGTTWVERQIDGSVTSATSIYAVDLDGDEDPDVVGASQTNGIWSWENIYDGDCRDGEYRADDIVGLIAAPDPGWNVEGWSGTEDDTSISLRNRTVMPATDHDATVHYFEGCFELTLTHSGRGADPVARPDYSEGCGVGRYLPGERIDLLATPAPEWNLVAWVGTDDDTSTELTNRLTMPANPHVASVEYQGCVRLFLGHTGPGADPHADPPYSPGCNMNEYLFGDLVTLTAAPDAGQEVVSWSGTDDDTSRELVNFITMPAPDHEVTVTYGSECFRLTFGHSGLGADPVASPWGDGTVWTEFAVQGEITPYSISTADVDGDGDFDVVGIVDWDDLYWWENSASDGRSWILHIVEQQFDFGDAVHTADIDGDGDIDVLGMSRSSSGPFWWENVVGDGTAWTEHEIVDGLNGESIFAADVDGDGDIDILGAGTQDDEITWWENVEGNGSSWARHVVDDDFLEPYSVSAADVDGDGDVDLLGAAYAGDAITWWENRTGGGRVWIKHVVDDQFDGAYSISGADVDGDGDVDLLGAAYLADEIAWWENVTGDGTVWMLRLVASSVDATRSLVAADMDGDDDLDLLGTAALDSSITWWENRTGDGTAWAEHRVDGPAAALSALAVDCNGDGDLDIVAAGSTRIAVWQNTYVADCPEAEYNEGARLGVSAQPAADWCVGSWSGTEDDSSTATDNSVLMPPTDHEVSVDYIEHEPGPVVTTTGACLGDQAMD